MVTQDGRYPLLTVSWHGTYIRWLLRMVGIRSSLLAGIVLILDGNSGWWVSAATDSWHGTYIRWLLRMVGIHSLLLAGMVLILDGY